MELKATTPAPTDPPPEMPADDGQGSPEAVAGQQAHALLAMLDTDRARAMGELELMDDRVMAESIRWAHDRIVALAEDAPRRWEERVDLSSIGCGWGYADAVVEDRRMLIEAKFGWGTPADALSWQCQALAAGLAECWGAKHVHVISVSGLIRETHGYVYTEADLAAARDGIARIRRACESAEAPLIPGAHCRWCRAAERCTAAAQDALALAAHAPTDEPRALAPYQVARLLELRRRLEQIDAAIREQAHRLWNAGAVIPGWRRVRTRTPRRWRNWEEARQAIEAWMAQTGQQLDLYRTTPRTPRDIEEQAAGIRELLATLTEQAVTWRIIPGNEPNG